jgi:polyphosphate kinase
VRYVHLATGNYNQQTARSYEDLSLFTAREEFGEDATSLFNLLTGYSAPDKWNQLLVAPLGLQEAILGLIHREKDHALAGRPARIVAKMNSLVDADVIAALYQASQAGVRIELLVRGICCLRPGVPGTSETIQVRALIDRFLEHARIYSFENGGAREVYCGSSDWMPRNFRRRVEVLFPVVDPALKQRINDEILEMMAADNVKGWRLGASGRYERAMGAPGEPPVRSQERFIELARQAAQVTEAIQPRGLKPAPVRESTLEKLRRKRRRRGAPDN